MPAGGASGGDPRGAPAADDVPPLADLLAHLDSDDYLDSLHELADSLLREIDAAAAGEAADVSRSIYFITHHLSIYNITKCGNQNDITLGVLTPGM